MGKIQPNIADPMIQSPSQNLAMEPSWLIQRYDIALPKKKPKNKTSIRITNTTLRADKHTSQCLPNHTLVLILPTHTPNKTFIV